MMSARFGIRAKLLIGGSERGEQAVGSGVGVVFW